LLRDGYEDENGEWKPSTNGTFVNNIRCVHEIAWVSGGVDNTNEVSYSRPLSSTPFLGVSRSGMAISSPLEAAHRWRERCAMFFDWTLLLVNIGLIALALWITIQDAKDAIDDRIDASKAVKARLNSAVKKLTGARAIRDQGLVAASRN
jgi:hypothetical protein